MEFSNDKSNSQTNPGTKRRMVCLVSHTFRIIVDTVVIRCSYHWLFGLPSATLGMPVSGGSPIHDTCLSLWCLCAESVYFPSPECYQFWGYLSVEEVWKVVENRVHLRESRELRCLVKAELCWPSVYWLQTQIDSHLSADSVVGTSVLHLSSLPRVALTSFKCSANLPL